MKPLGKKGRCQLIEQLLSARLDEQLDLQSVRSVDEHLASCARCQAAWRELQQTRELLQTVARVPVPSHLSEKVQARLGERPEGGQWIEVESCCRKLTPYVAAAMVLLTLLALLWPVPKPGSARGGSKVAISSGKPAEAPAGLSAPSEYSFVFSLTVGLHEAELAVSDY